VEFIQVAVQRQPPGAAGHIAKQALSRHPFERRMQRAASDPCHERMELQIGMDESTRLTSQDRPTAFLEQHVQVELLAFGAPSLGGAGGCFGRDRRTELMQLRAMGPTVCDFE